MGDEKDEKSFAKEIAIKAGVEVAKQAYEDSIAPVARNVGQLVAFPFRLLNASFSNVYLALTDHEARHRALEKGMAERWAKIPPERLVEPPPTVAGPLLLQYNFVQSEGDKPLREMYEQLLASSMDSAAQPDVHPAFVDALRQMTPGEARVINHLSTAGRFPIVAFNFIERKTGIHHRGGLAFIELPISSPRLGVELENLQRLGLVETPLDRSIPNESTYDRIHALVKERSPAAEGFQHFFQNGFVALTEYGNRFVSVCVTKSPAA